MCRRTERESDMRFLGGLLKTIAITLLLAATAGCTAVAVLYGGTDVYWAMGILWAVALFIALTAWGAGHALAQVHKLKKKLEQLEYRPQPPVRPAVSDPDFPEIHTAPRSTGKYTGQRPSGGAFATPKSSGNWIWVAVIIVLATATLACMLLLFYLKSRSPIVPPHEVAIPTAPEVIHVPMEPPVPETESPVETSAPAVATDISIGDSAVTDFVDIRFQNCVVKKDIKLSVKTGHVTRITGPDPLAGQQYICLTGKITNKTTAALPVYDFFLGNFSINGYNYKVSASDCDILTPDGRTVSNIDPLVEYDFRIYTAIPDALASSYTDCSFTFGFFDGFQNDELSHIRAFAEDPISQCPYQYRVILK